MHTHILPLVPARTQVVPGGPLSSLLPPEVLPLQLHADLASVAAELTAAPYDRHQGWLTASLG